MLIFYTILSQSKEFAVSWQTENNMDWEVLRAKWPIISQEVTCSIYRKYELLHREYKLNLRHHTFWKIKKTPTLKQNTLSHYLELYNLSLFFQFTVFKAAKSSESIIQEKSKYRLEWWNNSFKLLLTFQSSLPPVTVTEGLTWQHPFTCLLLLQDMTLIFVNSL